MWGPIPGPECLLVEVQVPAQGWGSSTESEPECGLPYLISTEIWRGQRQGLSGSGSSLMWTVPVLSMLCIQHTGLAIWQPFQAHAAKLLSQAASWSQGDQLPLSSRTCSLNDYPALQLLLLLLSLNTRLGSPHPAPGADTLREKILRIPMSRFKPSCACSPINPLLITELPPPAAEFTGHEPRADIIIPGKNRSPAASGWLLTPTARPGTGVQGAALGWGLIQAERLGLQRSWDSAPPSLQASGFSPVYISQTIMNRAVWARSWRAAVCFPLTRIHGT